MSPDTLTAACVVSATGAAAAPAWLPAGPAVLPVAVLLLPGSPSPTSTGTSAFTLPEGSSAWLCAYRKDDENLFNGYTASAPRPAST
ncbi:hypothetical protein ACFCX0_24945 [Streptomyces sp. NPDC056352]|uniref:hypothetical protein n=1 Tax=Streptomyces sp. NPDC056352 TaxID=3345791 RepID=UPI0035D9F655